MTSPSDFRRSLELLDRYLAGACDATESAAVRARIARDDRFRELEAALRDEVRHGTRPLIAFTTDEAAWARLRDTIQPRVAARHATRSRHARWLQAAASVAAAAVLGVAGWRGLVSRAADHGSATVYRTTNGQRTIVTLPDGGLVSLNVASRLDVPNDYAAGHRTVRLEGEALFTVAHDGRAPFTVVAGTSTTRVLGTRFVVRRYRTDDRTLVAVRDGKVAVQSTVLAAGQEADVRADGAIRIMPADPSRFTFAAGTLTFNGLPLADAIVELDRWYDADIRLGDPSMGTQRMHGEFAAGSLDNLAAILDLTFNVRVVRTGRTLTLYRK